MPIYKSTDVKQKSPIEGYNTSNSAAYFYLRAGKVDYYDPVMKTVDIFWLDNKLPETGLSVANMVSSGSVASGMPPCRGDVLLFSAQRLNFGRGKYTAVGYMASAGVPNRFGGFVWDSTLGKYVLGSNRNPESGEFYVSTCDNAEMMLHSDVVLNTASYTKLEMLASQDIIFGASRAINYSGSGFHMNVGMNSIPVAFFEGTDDLSIKSIAKNEIDPSEGTSNSEFNIKPVVLEDGKYLYSATPDDSKDNIDNGGKPFVEFDMFLQENAEPIPTTLGSTDLLNKKFLQPTDDSGTNEDLGHKLRVGFGTKIGKDPDKKKTYGRPVKRNVFKSEQSMTLETDEDKKEEPVKEKKKHIFTTAFWINLYKKGKELAFLELDKSGTLKFLLDGEKPEDDSEETRVMNSIEGRINGRVKISFGQQKQKSGASSGSDTTEGNEPNFDSNKVEEVQSDSFFSRFESGCNMYAGADGSDTSKGGFFLDCGTDSASANAKFNVTGEWHREVKKKELVKIHERSFATYEKEYIRSGNSYAVNKATNAYGIQGNPVNIVSANETGLIRLGIGDKASINEDSGAIENATEIIKGALGGSDYTIDFGQLNVVFKTSGNVTFDAGLVKVGKRATLGVGAMGSRSIVQNHSTAILRTELSNLLKVERGGSKGGFVYPR